MNTDEELWADVPYTDGEYQISNFGRLRSWATQDSKITAIAPSVLSQGTNGKGYFAKYLHLKEKGCHSNFLIHRLVAIEFVPNPNNFPIVMHKDDDKTNNHFTNLEWGTYSKNNGDALARKLRMAARGRSLNKSSLTEQDVLFILDSKETDRELCKKFNVNHTAISDIRSGRSWNHVTKLKCTRKKKPQYLNGENNYF